MTKAERDAFVDDFLANPEKYREEWSAKIRLEQPHLTEAQIAESWNAMAAQIGLPRAE